jgi:hypothetical protein
MGWGSSLRWELVRTALPLWAVAWVLFGTAGNRWT